MYAQGALYVTFSLPGYEETKLPISRKMNPAVSGDAVVGGLGGVAGASADASNNNQNEANPEMDVQLHHAAVGAAAAQDSQSK